MATRFPYQKVLIPVDFSEVSVTSLRHGLALARACGASVVLLSIVDTSFPYPDLYSFEDPNSDYYKVMRERALARMTEWLGELGDEAKGVEVERLVGRGRPAAEIPAMAREVGADVMVVGRHGSGAFRHAFMGNVIEALVRSAPCPVLVLPSPEPGPSE